jgi:formyl-CoA transferase
VAIADLFTGLYCSNAILAALYRREQSGEGAHIDLALLDTQLAMLANQASNYLVSGEDPVRQGNSHPNLVPYQPFAAADQPIIIAVGNDRQFARLAEILGSPEWASNPVFATNAARIANRAPLVQSIRQVIATKPASHWLAALEEAGIPAGPINRISQALADPQSVHRGAVQTLSGGRLGEVPTVGSPIRFDGQRADAPLPPPALGEHSDVVLKEMLGLKAAELKQLRAEGIIG